MNQFDLHELKLAEDALYKASQDAISLNPDFALHLNAFNVALDTIFAFSVVRIAEDDLRHTLHLLGIRLFNSATSTFRLVMMGYYQSGAAQMRDILEIINLIDAFRTHPELIPIWRKDAKTRQEKEIFSPLGIRKLLDERDGNTTQTRQHIYKIYSTLGTHVCMEGFVMLQREGSTLIQVGPFFDKRNFDISLHELAQRTSMAALLFTSLFSQQHPEEVKRVTALLDIIETWQTHFY